MNDPNGAQFEIIVDGKPRSYRDVKAVAIEAAIFLKEQRPTTEVSVRDMRDNSVTAISWQNGKASAMAPVVH
jgi:electron transfer flavoprotein alpha/beta subunit